LWLLNVLLDEGDSFVAVRAINGAMDSLRGAAAQYSEADGVQLNISIYARYIKTRVVVATIRGRDLVIKTADSPDYRHDNVLGMLRDGTLEALLELLEILTNFKFFIDDLDIPAVLQATQTIFNNFLYLYGCVTELLLNLFGTIEPPY
jgi:hypothetical protein